MNFRNFTKLIKKKNLVRKTLFYNLDLFFQSSYPFFPFVSRLLILYKFEYWNTKKNVVSYKARNMQRVRDQSSRNTGKVATLDA